MNKDEYWRTRSSGDAHAPELYKEVSAIRMATYFSDVMGLLPKDAKILEVGPMIGRNLEYFRMMGFKNFCGIEINQNAEVIFKQTFPETYDMTNFIQGDAKIELNKIDDKLFDLVFTVGCLQNIDNKNNILGEIARVSRCFIQTKEPDLLTQDANNIGLFFHDYENEFGKNGFFMIMKKVLPNNMFGNLPQRTSYIPVLRLFTRALLENN